MADRSCALSYRVPRSQTSVCRSTWIATTKKLRPMFYWVSMVWPTQYVLFSNRSSSIERKVKMKRVSGLLAAVTLLTLAVATAAFAQQPAEGVVIKQRIVQGPDGAPPPADKNIFFMASESFGGKTVKGAPYSAESVTESTQTLADGNRIINRITSAVYRDSEGRTRREQTLKGLEIGRAP